MDIMKRIEGWYQWNQAQGRKLERILVHPDDFSSCPETYEGLPVEFIGQRKLIEEQKKLRLVGNQQ